ELLEAYHKLLEAYHKYAIVSDLLHADASFTPLPPRQPKLGLHVSVVATHAPPALRLGRTVAYGGGGGGEGATRLPQHTRAFLLTVLPAPPGLHTRLAPGSG
ncbi:hypothetical protein T492DRAFT_877895, partial [Pavlovales sp. CCMP2436]